MPQLPTTPSADAASGARTSTREEERAGRRAHALRVEDVDTPADHHRVGTGRLGSTDDRAEVAGIGDRIEHDEERRLAEVFDRDHSLAADRDHRPRRDGGRHPLEHSFGDDCQRHVIDVDRRALAHVDVLEGPPRRARPRARAPVPRSGRPGLPHARRGHGRVAADAGSADGARRVGSGGLLRFG